MTTTAILEREMYTEAGAARLLDVPAGTLHYWLEGGRQGGKTYKPVIRTEPKGSRFVTWAEFVEAGLLRQYRRDHNVPMWELRGFIDSLRRRLGVPYLLAHAAPFVASGRCLVGRRKTRSGSTVTWRSLLKSVTSTCCPQPQQTSSHASPGKTTSRPDGGLTSAPSRRS
jgi:hypothetical protein